MDARTRRLLLGAVFFGGMPGPVLLLFGLKLAAASVSRWLNLEAVATALPGFFVFAVFGADSHHTHAHTAGENRPPSQRHNHPPLVHAHHHWPDLHHRHEH